MAILAIIVLTELIGRMCLFLNRYFVSYNFKYVKNACTEKSEHKYTQILRMVVQVVGVWDFFASYIHVQSTFKNVFITNVSFYSEKYLKPCIVVAVAFREVLIN